jgi:hypothetical protein
MILTRQQSPQNWQPIALGDKVASRPSISMKEIFFMAQGNTLAAIFPLKKFTIPKKWIMYRHHVFFEFEKEYQKDMVHPFQFVFHHDMFPMYGILDCKEPFSGLPPGWYLVYVTDKEMTLFDEIALFWLCKRRYWDPHHFILITRKKVSVEKVCRKKWEHKWKETCSWLRWTKQFENVIRHDPSVLPVSRSPYIDKAVAPPELCAFATEMGLVSMIPFVSRAKTDALQKCGKYTIADLRTEDDLFQKHSNQIKANMEKIPIYCNPQLRENKEFVTLCTMPPNRIHFIDFEWNTQQQVYLIGVVCGEDYRAFFAPRQREGLDYCALCLQFQNYLSNHSDDIFVYYKAEKKMFQSWCKRLNVESPSLHNWIDYYPFVKLYLGFHGHFDSRLKSIQSVLTKEGLLSRSFPEGCANGLQSLYLYQEFVQHFDMKVRAQLEAYNAVDCYTLSSLHFVLVNLLHLDEKSNLQ